MITEISKHERTEGNSPFTPFRDLADLLGRAGLRTTPDTPNALERAAMIESCTPANEVGSSGSNQCHCVLL
jgi:hypothetical protein